MNIKENFYIYLYFHMTWGTTDCGWIGNRFTGLLQIVTTSYYTVSLIRILHSALQHLLHLLNLLCLCQLPDNGFPCCSSFSFDVPWFRSSLAVIISQQDSMLLRNGPSCHAPTKGCCLSLSLSWTACLWVPTPLDSQQKLFQPSADMPQYKQHNKLAEKQTKIIIEISYSIEI
jgi:hypothetical protein